MTKITTTLLTILTTATISFGQITTTKVAPEIVQTDNSPYDSIQNFLGKEVNKYIGQELYLKGITEGLRKFGYADFYSDYKKGKFGGGVYKCCDSYNSKYDDLNGKYFKVLEIIKHPESSESKYDVYGKRFYLKLEEKTSKDLVYFDYKSNLKHEFPFIVVGFFEKQKMLTSGKEFVFVDKLLQNSTDIETGKVITKKTGQVWKCVDLTINEKYYTLSLVIQNSLGEKTTMDYEYAFREGGYNWAYTSVKADNYRKKFGSENWNLILNGKTKIGMTKEMCKLSWGEPKSINETITAGKKTEQWVYSDNYLYFDNGILTTMQ
jgi:hypothetical protein